MKPTRTRITPTALAAPMLAAALIALAGCDARDEEPWDSTVDGTEVENADDELLDGDPVPADLDDDITEDDDLGNPNLSSPPPDSVGPNAAVTVSDVQVLSIMLMVDNREAEIGRLAQKKAESDAAKRLAGALVEDHTTHAEKVRNLAASENVELLDEQAAQRVLDRLKGGASPGPGPLSELTPLSGAEFDRRFGELMAAGHADLIRILEATRPQLIEPAVRTLVDETIPVLRRHEQLAREIVDTPPDDGA